MKILFNLFILAVVALLGANINLSQPASLVWFTIVCVLSVTVFLDVLARWFPDSYAPNLEMEEEDYEEWTVQNSIEDFQDALYEDNVLFEYHQTELTQSILDTLRETKNLPIEGNSYYIADKAATNYLSKFIGETE